jgi:FMN-dependent NADH-azoreductase
MDKNFISKYFDKNISKKKSFQYLENGPLSVLKPVVDIIY